MQPSPLTSVSLCYTPATSIGGPPVVVARPPSADLGTSRFSGAVVSPYHMGTTPLLPALPYHGETESSYVAPHHVLPIPEQYYPRSNIPECTTSGPCMVVQANLPESSGQHVGSSRFAERGGGKRTGAGGRGPDPRRNLDGVGSSTEGAPPRSSGEQIRGTARTAGKGALLPSGNRNHNPPRVPGAGRRPLVSEQNYQGVVGGPPAEMISYGGPAPDLIQQNSSAWADGYNAGFAANTGLLGGNYGGAHGGEGPAAMRGGWAQEQNPED